MDAVKGSKWNSELRRTFFLSLALIVLTLVVYLPSIGYDFIVIDDNVYVYDNPWIKLGLSWEGVVWAFTTMHAGYWLPVTWLSLLLDYSWWGLFAGGYHLTNIILHAANVMLLFLLLKQITGNVWAGAWVAAFFALHPLRVESVAWVTERKDVLSTFFLLLALRAYCQYVERLVIKRLVLSLLFFSLGLMAKPMLVTMPCVLLLLDFWPLHRLKPASSYLDRQQALRNWARLILEKAPFFVIALVAGIVTIATQHSAGAVKSLETFPFTLRLSNAFLSYLRYLWLSVWPVDLCVFYPFPAEIPPSWVAGSVLALAAITYMAFRWRHRFSWLFVGWLWYLITLVPVAGFLQSGSQAAADRFTYVPLIGVYLMMIWSVDRFMAVFPTTRVASHGLLGVLLALCIITTRNYLPYWRNSIPLLQRTLALTGENAVAENNMGVALAEAGRGDEAEVHYLEAIRLNPRNALARYNLGIQLVGRGNFSGAEEQFVEALKINPKSEKLHNNLGVVLAQQGHLVRALECFRKSIALNPDYPNPYLNLGKALQKQGATREALGQFEKALELDPHWPEVLDTTALLLINTGETNLFNPEAAIKLATRANELTDGKVPQYLDTLSQAYAAAGNYSNAVQTAQLAHQLAVEKSMTELAGQLGKNLDDYRAGRRPSDP